MSSLDLNEAINHSASVVADSSPLAAFMIFIILILLAGLVGLGIVVKALYTQNQTLHADARQMTKDNVTDSIQKTQVLEKVGDGVSALATMVAALTAKVDNIISYLMAKKGGG